MIIKSGSALTQSLDSSGGSQLIMFKTIGVRLPIATLLMTFLLGGCILQAAKPEPVRVGLIASPQGEIGQLGRSTIESAEMAVKEVNDAGGLLVGRQRIPVELIIEDDQNLPEMAVDAARKLIMQDGVVALIGPQVSRTAIRVSEIAQEAQVPMISPGSSHPATTAGKPFVYRIAMVDTNQGEVMARFARQDLGIQRAAVLFDAANPYNSGMAEIFSRIFQQLGGELAAYESYSTGEVDFTKQLAAIQASDAEFLYLPNYAHELTLQTEQASQMGLHPIFGGNDTWSEYLDSDRPAVLEGSFYTAHFTVDSPGDAAAGFIARFQEANGRLPDNAAALTYDAFSLLFTVIEQQGEATSEAIQQGLRESARFEGVTGTISYDGTGDPERSIIIMQITNQTAVPYRMVMP